MKKNEKPGSKRETLIAQGKKIVKKILTLFREAGYSEDGANNLLRTIKGYSLVDLLVGNTVITEAIWDAKRFRREIKLNEEQSEEMARLVGLLIEKERAIIKCG